LIGTLPSLVEATIPTKHAVAKSVRQNPGFPREDSAARTEETTLEPIQKGMIAPNLRVTSCSARIRSAGPSASSAGWTAASVPNSFPVSVPAGTRFTIRKIFEAFI
jgi:hypothetical protein